MKIKKTVALALGFRLLFSPAQLIKEETKPFIQVAYAADLNFSALQRAVDDSSSVYNSVVYASADETDRQNYKGAVEDGKKLLAKTGISQKDINYAVERINNCKNNLINERTLTRAKLYKKINEGKNYIKGSYDENRKKALAKVLNDAISTFNNDKLEASAYQKAYNEVDKAIKAMTGQGNEELIKSLLAAKKKLQTSMNALRLIKSLAPSFVARTELTYNSLVNRVNSSIKNVDKALASLGA